MFDAEYHAFGPWIMEVNDKHPLPALFVPYYNDDNNYLMRIKIPRNINRRTAKPGMDLYDYVLGMYKNHLYILKRKDKTVEEIKISYRDIEVLEDFRDLLSGKLTIYLKDKKIEIPYNTVSEDIISRLMKIIREHYTNKIYEKIQSPYDEKQTFTLDPLYKNLLIEMKKSGENPDINVIQPSIELRTNSNQLKRNLLQLITGQILLSSLSLSNNKELLMLSRGKFFTKRREAVYSYVHTYIPIEKLLSVSIEKEETPNNLLKLHIKTKEHSFLFYFDENNKELKDYYKSLNALISMNHSYSLQNPTEISV